MVLLFLGLVMFAEGNLGSALLSRLSSYRFEAHLSSGRSIILTVGTSEDCNIRATSSRRLS
jgi:hypothetical protein